jgi:hypothetical protein
MQPARCTCGAAAPSWRGLPHKSMPARRAVRLRDRPRRLCDVDLIWEQVLVDAHDPVALGRWWAEALGWVVVGDTADEFEIRTTPDRVPGLLFVPVQEEKAGKNRLHPDFRPVDQTAEVERLLSSVLGASASRRAAFLDPERSGLVIRDCRCTGGKSDLRGRGFP